MPHTYKINGYEYQSVTTIISDCTKKDALMQWAANCTYEYIKNNKCDIEKSRFEYKRQSKKALRDGSLVHRLIEENLKGHNPRFTYNKEVENAYSAFFKFKENYKLKLFALEKIVHGDYWAGTRDFIGFIGKDLWVLDWKTSSGMYGDDARIQLAAYRSESKIKVTGIPQAQYLVPTKHGVVRFDKKTGEYEFKDYSKYYYIDLKKFKLMVELFYLRHPRLAKKAGWEEEENGNS